MTESAAEVEQVACDIRLAYEMGDVERFGALLAPNVTWGSSRWPVNVSEQAPSPRLVPERR